MDELLKQLPEDRIWRAGENQVTTLHTETALMISDQKIEAGKYSLYVYAPTEGPWALCINKNLGIPLGEMWAEAPDNMKKEPWPVLMSYQKNIGSEEVARVEMSKMDAEESDSFSISFEGNALQMVWGDAPLENGAAVVDYDGFAIDAGLCLPAWTPLSQT